VNDIDFDELDKAIGSASGGTPVADAADTAEDAANTVVDQPKEKLADIAKSFESSLHTDDSDQPAGTPEVTIPSDESHDPLDDLKSAAEDFAEHPADEASDDADSTDQSTPDATPETPEEPVPTVPRPQNGRFMDMVHSSSDVTVKRPVVPPAPTQSVSREAADVAPLTTDEPETPTEPEATDADASPEEQLASEVNSIDFSNVDDEATGTESAPEESKLDSDTDVAPADTDENAAETTETDTESNGTPFIPDAKVDKRPLGGGVSTTVDSLGSTGLGTSALDSDNTSSIYAQDAPATSGMIAPGQSAKPPKKGGGALSWILIILGVILIGGGAGFAAWLFLFQ
jgi:hypothetical protein